MKRLAGCLAAIALLLSAAVALAAPGDLDSSFDGDGVRTIDFGGDDRIDDLLIQPDGRIVATGTGYLDPRDFVVGRLKLDGSLDTSFDGDGKASVGFGSNEAGGAGALQPDGKIVVAGGSSPAGGTIDFRILRLTADGLLDPTFDDDGKATIDFGGVDYGNDVLVQPDGKIVVAGGVFSDLAVVRLSSDGSVEGGARRADFGASSEGYGMALQPDGKIVVVGELFEANDSDIAVARYNADLTLDTSFDGDGRRTIDLGGSDFANEVLVQPDGKIVLTGLGFPNQELAVTRLNAGGSLDSSFDGDGTARVDVGDSARRGAAALQVNGKVVVVGSAGSQATLLRFQPGGALDTTFSGDGKQPLPVTGSARGVALLGDGRIVAAGDAGGDGIVALVEGDSPASGGGGPGGGGAGGGAFEVPRCADRKATIVGTGKADRLKGTRRADVIVGLGGNDKIDGGRGNDLVCAGDGNDRVKGSSGNDRLFGQSGNDKLNGGVGRDALSGGAGRDGLMGGPGKDRLAGGPGKDRLRGGSGKDSCNGGAGKDRAACEQRRAI